MPDKKHRNGRNQATGQDAAPRAFLRNSTVATQQEMSGTIKRSLLNRLGHINTDDSPQKVIQKLNNSQFQGSRPAGPTAVEIICPGFSGRFEVRDLCAMTRSG